MRSAKTQSSQAFRPMTSPARLGTDVSIATPRRSHAATTQLAETAPKRLLVVDDEESIRIVLGRFLRGRGYEVVTADSAASALDILGNHRFLLALCDIRMPGMTG